MTIPEHFAEISLGMSNFDREIDDGFEEAIKEKPCFGRHAGWGFNGRVYYLDNQFCEDVWVYRAYRETITADTLTELMTTVNNQYGWK